jgi:hypothetical protein
VRLPEAVVEAVVTVQFARARRFAPPFQVIGTGADDEPPRRHVACDQAGVLERPEADRAVVAFGHEVDDPVVEIDVEDELRMTEHEIGGERLEVQRGEGGRGRDPEHAPRLRRWSEIRSSARLKSERSLRSSS